MKNIYVTYEKLLDSIFNIVNKLNKKRIFISVSGFSRSGKTYLSNKIQNDLKKRNIKDEI